MLPWSSFPLLLLAIASADATRVMHRPANYTQPPNKVATAKRPVAHKVQSRATAGKTQLGYFTNWSAILLVHEPAILTPT